jgi:hypothetical protein
MSDLFHCDVPVSDSSKNFFVPIAGVLLLDLLRHTCAAVKYKLLRAFNPQLKTVAIDPEAGQVGCCRTSLLSAASANRARALAPISALGETRGEKR